MRPFRVLVALAVLTFALTVHPAVVPIASACSCVMQDDPVGTAAAEPATAIFTGIVQPPSDVATPVLLTRWFKGIPGGPAVGLDNRGFEDPFGGMCGTARPPAGSEWIFIAGTNERGLFDVSLCTPHASLAEPSGQEMLMRAIALLGPGTVTPPEATAVPADPVSDGGPGAEGVAMLVAASIAGLGLAAAAAALFWRRRPA